jgi:hypothetical protein
VVQSILLIKLAKDAVNDMKDDPFVMLMMVSISLEHSNKIINIYIPSLDGGAGEPSRHNRR